MTVDALGLTTTPSNAYTCSCVARYGNGACDYNCISQYAAKCAVATGATCDLDVDECQNSSCKNGATCTDSTVETTVSVHAYRCTCTVGFANGMCGYSYIAQYTATCNVTESSASTTLSGNCDLDVNECQSSPCQNGANCTDSAAVASIGGHTYRCTFPCTVSMYITQYKGKMLGE